jgi:glyoxylase-like metal-dependent hydrolase (beta-lactamase superfamily II)
MLNRRQFLARLAAAGAALPLMPGLRRDEAFVEIRRGVGTFVGRGGTIGWLATPEALVVVDTQFPDTAAQCRDGLAGRTPHALDLLVNTHHHGDHTAGNGVFRPHATQHVAHQNVPVLQRAAAERQNRLEGQVYANTTYDTEWQQTVGDEVLRLRYYGPAHTGGDSVVHFVQADVVHMGDLVFNRTPAFIDRVGGASVRGWVTLLERVHDDFSDTTRFIFGHGSPAFGITGGRADLLVMRDFLSALLAYVQQGIRDGKSADELATLEQLPGFPDHYNPERKEAFANGLRAIHAELTTP